MTTRSPALAAFLTMAAALGAAVPMRDAPEPVCDDTPPDRQRHRYCAKTWGGPVPGAVETRQQRRAKARRDGKETTR